MTVDMHGNHTHARFADHDLDLDFENLFARPTCVMSLGLEFPSDVFALFFFFFFFFHRMSNTHYQQEVHLIQEG